MALGEPADVAGECNARLYIGDNYGDNHATMRCRLPAGHEGWHAEEWNAHDGQAKVTWEEDQREFCEHGIDEYMSCPECEAELAGSDP